MPLIVEGGRIPPVGRRKGLAVMEAAPVHAHRDSTLRSSITCPTPLWRIRVTVLRPAREASATSDLPEALFSYRDSAHRSRTASSQQFLLQPRRTLANPIRWRDRHRHRAAPANLRDNRMESFGGCVRLGRTEHRVRDTFLSGGTRQRASQRRYPRTLADKQFGVFDFAKEDGHPLLVGTAERCVSPLPMNEVQADALKDSGYFVLTQSAEGVWTRSSRRKHKASLSISRAIPNMAPRLC